MIQENVFADKKPERKRWSKVCGAIINKLSLNGLAELPGLQQLIFPRYSNQHGILQTDTVLSVLQTRYLPVV